MSQRYIENQQPNFIAPKIPILHYPSIDDIKENSPFINGLALKYPDICADISLGHPTVLAQKICQEVDNISYDQSEISLLKALRDARNKIAMVLGIGEMSGKITGSQSTEWLSNFQSSSLSTILAFCLKLLVKKDLISFAGDGKPPSETSARQYSAESGFFILGLGKLGGKELNYSSDIDIILLYNPDRLHAKGKKSLGSLMVRLARQLVDFMERRTEQGYVARVDIRLRPDPSSTPLAITTLAAERYYQSKALNWERAAFIKARVVAGDRNAGAQFLDQIRPWLWRRSIDFLVLDDLARLKSMATTHSLAQQRPKDAPDVKLGTGGIREIEFYTQIYQLLFGGKNTDLRSFQTESGLKALNHAGHISSEITEGLVQAYWFLRRVEHSCQIRYDAQTHHVPEVSSDRKSVARLAGFTSLAQFDAVLKDQRSYVHTCYSSFMMSPDDNNADNSAPLNQEILGQFAQENHIMARVSDWQNGKIKAISSEKSRYYLAKCLPELLKAFSQTPDPDATFYRFDRLLCLLPAGTQLFALFNATPDLMALVARLMGFAPAMGDSLAINPLLLGSVLEPYFFQPLPSKKDIEKNLALELEHCPHEEAVFDTLRRFHQEYRFKAAVHLIEGLAPPEKVGRLLSNLADVIVQSCLKMVRYNFEKRHGIFEGQGLILIALGRWGGRSLTFSSDLDLIYLYHISHDPEKQVLSNGFKPLAPSAYFSRLAQKLTGVLTMSTVAGALYDVDTRLRPSGAQGPIAVSLETFQTYFNTSAWIWEKLALTRARVISEPRDISRSSIISEQGSDSLAITDAVRPSGNAKDLLQKTRDMREKLRENFDKNLFWDVKHGKGGLVDLEFTVQYLLLDHFLHAPKDKDRIPPDLDDSILFLQDKGKLSPKQAKDLIKARKTLYTILIFLRLGLGDALPKKKDLSSGFGGLLLKVFKQQAFDGVIKKLQKTRCVVSDYYSLFLPSIP